MLIESYNIIFKLIILICTFVFDVQIYVNILLSKCIWFIALLKLIIKIIQWWLLHLVD